MRLMKEEDVNWVTELLNRKLYLDHFTPGQVYARVFDDSSYTPSLNLVEEGKAVILGVKRGEIAHIKAIASEKGLGSYILKEWEKNAEKLGVREIQVGGGLWYFFPGLDPRYTEALCFFFKQGYTRTPGDDVDMSLDLQSFQHEPREIPGVVLRRLEERDKEALKKFMLENFSEGWLEETLAAYKNDPISCHIAEVDGEVIAFAAYEVTNPGYFGPTGTKEAMRRRGIGGELLRRSLMDLKKLGYKKAIIPWVGPICYYWRSVGAKIHRVYWHLHKVLQV
ncbi:GNAT family N-acetyltransferase [bacterium]|nr:GNAT family N-acetyltransferase [bacterium]